LSLELRARSAAPQHRMSHDYQGKCRYVTG
jgi:hypothetical protein